MIILIILSGLLGLGILVFIHEGGHFIAAKLCGVFVETFSLGWGKKLVGFKYKGTNYQIAWFPIGGYCKMKGEMQTPAQIEKEDFNNFLNTPGSYLATAWWKKIIISAAGPLANLIFAIMIFTLTAFIGYNVISEQNKIIIANLNRETPAITAGLKTGDVILEVNNTKIQYFTQFETLIRKNPNKKLYLKIQRENQVIDITAVPELYKMMGRLGIYGWVDPEIISLDKGSAADKAGLKKGDRILMVNTIPIQNQIDFMNAIQDKPASVQIDILRNEQSYSINFDLKYDKEGNPDLGMSFLKKYRTPKINLGKAFLTGMEEAFEVIDYTIKGFIFLFSAEKEDLKDAVAGPIRITQMVGEVTIFGFKLGFSDGITNFFRFICLLSVIIGFMNMIPIPALDGGQIVLSLYMLFSKNKISPKFLYRYQIIGFFIVFVLLTISLFSDIFNIIN